jgi:hypothetical protein
MPTVSGRSRRCPRAWLALAGVQLALLLTAALAPPALAGAPATVTVRVLVPTNSGDYESLTPITRVTTTILPVTKYGGSCSGTSAGGALELATKGDWEGTWSDKYNDYELTSIDGKSFPFEESSTANYYWSFWRNNVYSEVGVCEAELEAGDQILFFPSCYGTGCPPEPQVLGIEAPPTAEAGKPLTVTVNRYNPKGEPSPAAGVAVAGGGASAETDVEGHATLTFADDDTFTLRAEGPPAEAPKSVPGEALVCVHTGDDGTCGTPPPPGTPIAPSSNVPSVPAYTGPYALVARVSGIAEGHVFPRGDGPRVLAGTVSAHATAVTSISLRLRRTYRGRCWAYDGSSARLRRVRCHRGGFFRIASGGSSFSYLLPSRLPPGRYVLDIEATDAAGARTPLDRGSSRIVFYVK